MATAPSDPNRVAPVGQPHEDPAAAVCPPADLAPAVILRPSWWATFCAPYRFIFQPRRAAATMVAGPRWAAWLALGVGIILIVCLTVGATLWSKTVTVEWDAASDAAGLPIPILQERSLEEAWAQWRGESAAAAAVRALLYGGIPVLLSAAFMAWLQLPRVHRSGRTGASLLRAFFGVVSGIGLLVLLVALLGAVGAVVQNNQDRQMGAASVAMLPEVFSFVVALGYFAAVLGLIFWVECACVGARDSGPTGSPSPRCERCGYDLTHVPASGRCPECGTDVQAMLVPGMRRPGCSWEESPGALTWRDASLALLFRPSSFYARLQVWTSDTMARRFAAWHYIVLFVGATLWGNLVAWRMWGAMSTLWSAVVVYALVIPLSCLLAGWGIQRLLAAVVGSVWLVGGTMPDFRPIWKVLSYETAYLWVFVVYDGLLMTSLFLFGDWMSALVVSITGTTTFRGVPESLAVLLGNGVLCALWLWRYRLACDAVRWANF